MSSGVRSQPFENNQQYHGGYGNPIPEMSYSRPMSYQPAFRPNMMQMNPQFNYISQAGQYDMPSNYPPTQPPPPSSPFYQDI